MFLNVTGHGPFSHMFEYGVYRQLKLEHRSAFIEEQPPGPPAPKKPKNQSQVEGTPKSLKWEVYSNNNYVAWVWHWDYVYFM